jgi:hypothetical protein
MRKFILALAAAGVLAATALPAAAAEQKSSGVTNPTMSTEQFSARRYYRHYGYYRPYYRPYYAYGPGPYYYGSRYYRPAPWPFFPFF